MRVPNSNGGQLQEHQSMTRVDLGNYEENLEEKYLQLHGGTPTLMLPAWVGNLGLHACHIGKYST